MVLSRAGPYPRPLPHPYAPRTNREHDMEGVRGAYLGYSNSAWQEQTFEIRKDVLEFPPILIEEYSDSAAYVASLRPIFDALWNAGGLSRSNYFDDDGRWNPPR